MQVCENCHFMGKGINNFWNGYIFHGIWIIGASIGIFFQADLFGYTFLFNLIAIYLIISSTVGIVKNYYGGTICPKCNHKTMLPMDSPEAIKLIKQHDLEPGDKIIKENNLCVPE